MNKDYYCADLKGADFSNQVLRLRDFSGANLTGANLSGGDFSGSNFVGAILDEANLTNSNLKCAMLLHASFYKANFTGADLSGAELYNTFIDKAIGLGTKECEMLYAQALLTLIKCGVEVLPIPNSQENSLKYPTIAAYFNNSSNRETYLALKRIASGEQSVFTSPFANL